MAMTEKAGAMQIAKGLKGLDTSKVEVDDDQAPPAYAAGSPEEKALLNELATHMMKASIMERYGK